MRRFILAITCFFISFVTFAIEGLTPEQEKILVHEFSTPQHAQKVAFEHIGMFTNRVKSRISDKHLYQGKRCLVHIKLAPSGQVRTINPENSDPFCNVVFMAIYKEHMFLMPRDDNAKKLLLNFTFTVSL
ncbi:cell envelope integrity protein TolA [Vibrio fluvialis]|nr:cell envelope integrity protein TolA [Vibrio fluvialis]